MEVFHKRTSFLIYDAAVRLRQGFRLHFIPAGQGGGTDFPAGFAVVLPLPIHPLVAGWLAQT